MQLLRSALDEGARSGSQTGEVKSLDEVVAFNSRVAGAQLERVSEFWANWWRAAGDAHKSLIEQFQSQMGQATERVRESSAFTARAAEDTARLAASQVQSHEQRAKEHRKSA